ncbi:MAG: nucleoside diphosphate kinase regulator [Clostridiales bacterium]|jgi:regulator of nucleoside diphosphate kinase|nr:nucleoside diphosphate kinase regulator [Clostridiales bacterium]
MSTNIYISNLDKNRIRKIIEDMYLDGRIPDKTVKKLEDELERAITVNPQKMPHDIVTMNSRVLLHLDDEDIEVSLTYPDEADLSSMKLSVFSPIGTAILGYREGCTVEWDVPSGKATIDIKKILYQPEASGDYHL